MKNLLRHSYTCMSIHGGIDQYDRDSTMDDFKSGNIKLLVSCVINDLYCVVWDVKPYYTIPYCRSYC